jgi:hypothetical protein
VCTNRGYDDGINRSVDAPFPPASGARRGAAAAAAWAEAIAARPAESTEGRCDNDEMGCRSVDAHSPSLCWAGPGAVAVVAGVGAGANAARTAGSTEGRCDGGAGSSVDVPLPHDCDAGREGACSCSRAKHARCQASASLCSSRRRARSSCERAGAPGKRITEL